MRKLALVCVVLLLCFSAAADVQVRASRIDGALPAGVWGDFNGDGLDDVLRHNKLQWNVGGRFAAPITLPEFDERTYFLTDAIDLNSDGYADLVSPGERNPDRLFLGDGFGGFTEHPFTGEYGITVKVADFTSDGRPDVLTFRPGKLSILSNDGSANFTLHQDLPWPENHLFPAVGLGDLNGDGTTDFVIAAETNLYIFYANAEGVFGAPRVRFTRRRLGEVAIADVTGDGRKDLAGLHVFEGKETPVVLNGDGAGRFPGAMRLRVDNKFNNDSVVVGDFVPGGAKEIAYAEPNGTVHIVSAINGQMRDLGSVTIDAEVRPWVDNIGPTLSVRRFRSADRDDLIIQAYSMDVHANPPRRVWLIDAQGSIPATAASNVRSRTRAVGGFADRVTGDYRVDILESSCPLSLPDLTFQHEGMFVDVGLDERIRGAEAVFIDGTIWIRMTVLNEGVTRELNGTLRPAPTGGFAGTLYEDGTTPCGNWQWHKLTLTTQ
ncbi:MAG TPA: VCBS repeat-containing protein [Thermoanaerobaculia bacterium]|nr:VCBS repeat-containing protein [Thermoanaerobaculia bacterium]